MTESFESATAPPTGWSIVYQDPTPTTTSAFAPYLLHNKMMHISPQDPYQPPFTHYAHDTAAVGSKVFRFSSYASDTSNLYQQYLISPPLNVTAANDSVAFLFRQADSRGERFRLGWSTTTNDTSAFTYDAEYVTVRADTVWQLYYKNDLPLNTKYICINYSVTTDRYGLFIDGYYGPPGANLDAGIVDMDEPVYPGTSDISIDFVNSGNNTLTSLQFDYEIDGIAQPTVIWNGTMPQDSLNTNYTLGSYNFTPGIHTVKIWSSAPNGGADENRNNDTITRTIITVNDPTAYAGGPADICAGSNYDITTASASDYSSISWSTSGTGNFVNGNTLSPNYIPSSADTAAGSVTLTLTAHGYPGHPDATSSALLTIHGTPDVDFSGLQAAYCPGDPDQALTPSPNGGTFTGNGISGYTFQPSAVSPGAAYNIKYSYTDTYGCSNEITRITTVYNETAVTFSGLASGYCNDDPVATLNGSPGGGTFTVDGNPMGGNSFDPSAYTNTSHVVVYSYTDVNGCDFSESKTTTIHASPNVTITGLAAEYCSDDASVTLSGTPAGGSFTVNGSAETTFDPGALGAGNHTVVYTYTDPATGCTNTANQPVTVHAPPATPDFSGLASDYCVDASAVTLSGNPGGGSFSGPGISGSDFDPAVAGAGNHTISYTYTDGNGCSASTSQNTTVHDLPVVANTTSTTGACVSGSAVTLTGTPTGIGGSFSGAGVSGNQFDPGTAGVGTHTITYTYTDSYGCTNSGTKDIEVYNLPTVSISGLASDFCVDDATFTMSGSPAGGTFSGPGVSGQDFDPASAGSGSHTITYTYTDPATGCTNTANQPVTVHALPAAPGFSGLASDYCVDASAVSLSGAPGGGSFSGPGISGSDFDPAVAGAGNHTISYTYTDGNGCSASTSQNTTVHDLPVVANTTSTTGACVSGSAVTLTGTPTGIGGSFSGAGVSGSQFDPGTAGVGTHAITYSYTDGNGCTNSHSKDIEVYNLPAVSFSGLATEYCADAVNDTLTGSPAGGTFTISGGAGIQNSNEFAPAVAGAGTHTITYTYTDASGCTNSSSQNVTVNALPAVSFTGLDAEYCRENINDTLTGTPLGGSFSGMGVSGYIFNPGSVPGDNNINITYSYTDSHGCSSSITQSTFVRGLPDASFTGLQTSYCMDASVDTMVPANPGGTFTGPGVSGLEFDPALAGTGSHDITYTYTDIDGCTNSDIQTIDVNALPVVDFSGLSAEYCLSRQNVNLTGSPAGGVFTGPAVTGTQFSPAMAGAGVHTINYAYTDMNGCFSDTSKQVTVHTLPDATFTGLAGSYCRQDALDTLAPVQSGGFFLGKGVNMDSVFNPYAAGPGFHEISYWIFDQNGCFDSTIQNVVIYPNPVANISGLKSSYCEDEADISLAGIPAGGTFSGTGMNGNVFSPSQAGDGNHQITYQYTNSFGCSDVKKRSVQVDSLPAVSFSGLMADYCADDPADTLLGVPNVAGGVFLGKGINGNVFDPSLAQAGNWKIIYHVTTPAGCMNSDTQFVDVKPLPKVYLGMDTVICYGDSIELTDVKNSASSYAWSTGSLADTIMVKPYMDSTYSVTATLNGCTKSDNILIEISEPYVDLGSDTEICAEDTYTLYAGMGFETYLWSTGATTSSITMDSTGIGLDSVFVSVIVTDEYGCSATDTVLVDFDRCDNGIGKDMESRIVVYPNPGDGLFTVEAPFRKDDKLMIYDSHGRKLREYEAGAAANSLQFDVRKFERGVYYLILLRDDMTYSRKLIISR